MRRFRTILLMSFAVLLVSVFFKSPVVFGSEVPSGEPPYGVAIKGDAMGIRLSGVLVIEFLNYNFMTKIAEKASVVVRLRKGGELRAFFCTVPGPLSPTDPAGVQNAVMLLITSPILDAFCSECTTLTLKFMGESIDVDGEAVLVTPKKGLPYPLGTYYFVTDVEFAAK